MRFYSFPLTPSFLACHTTQNITDMWNSMYVLRCVSIQQQQKKKTFDLKSRAKENERAKIKRKEKTKRKFI